MKTFDNQQQLENRIDRFLEEKLKKYPEIAQPAGHYREARFTRTW